MRKLQSRSPIRNPMFSTPTTSPHHLQQYFPQFSSRHHTPRTCSDARLGSRSSDLLRRTPARPGSDARPGSLMNRSLNRSRNNLQILLEVLRHLLDLRAVVLLDLLHVVEILFGAEVDADTWAAGRVGSRRISNWCDKTIIVDIDNNIRTTYNPADMSSSGALAGRGNFYINMVYGELHLLEKAYPSSRNDRSGRFCGDSSRSSQEDRS